MLASNFYRLRYAVSALVIVLLAGCASTTAKPERAEKPSIVVPLPCFAGWATQACQEAHDVLTALEVARRQNELTQKQARLLGIFEFFGFWRAPDAAQGAARLEKSCAAGDSGACTYLQFARNDLGALVEACSEGIAASCELLTFHLTERPDAQKMLNSVVREKLDDPTLDQAAQVRLESVIIALHWRDAAIWQPALLAANALSSYADQRTKSLHDFYVKEIALNNCLSDEFFSVHTALSANLEGITQTCRATLSSYNQFTVFDEYPEWTAAARSREAMIYFRLARWMEAQMERANASEEPHQAQVVYETARTVKQLSERGDKAYADALRRAFECDCSFWSVLQAEQYRRDFWQKTVLFD